SFTITATTIATAIIIAAAGGTMVTVTAAGSEMCERPDDRAVAEREFFLGGAITGCPAAPCGLTPARQLYLRIGSASFSYTLRLPTYAGASVGARTSFAKVNNLQNPDMRERRHDE